MNDQYMWILNQWVRGLIEVPVVHTTYLIRSDVIEDLNYIDASERHEYVVFSESARRAQIPQYLDNRQVYGYIAFGKDNKDEYVEGGIARAKALLQKALVEDGSEAASRVIPRVIACFGLHSSGSTWTYNAVREICKAGSIPFVSVHRDSSANLPWDAPGRPLIIAKTHNPMADFQKYIFGSDDPVVITVRDPRDALVSYMQRFPKTLGKDFALALESIALSATRLVDIVRRRKAAVFRYEDGFIESDDTIDKLASMVGVALERGQRSAITESLTPDAVRETIRRQEAAGIICGEDIWDRETHWHAGHLHDGKSGKWRDVLSEDQAREVVKRTQEFCELFGYDTQPLTRTARTAT